MLIWVGFVVSFLFILIVARRSLWGALFGGSYLLGIFSLSPLKLAALTWKTISDSTVIFLAIAVSIIPVIGGILERSGLMDDFVKNLPLRQKMTMVFSAAFVGMLTMPGGALLSAPMVQRSGRGVSAARKSAINVWFRHLLLLVYPLGVLLATSAMANIDLYTAVFYLLPGFAVMTLTGTIFLLRNFPAQNNRRSSYDFKKFFIPVFTILIAPILHFSLMKIFPALGQEIPLLIGVTVSLLLSIRFSKINFRDFKAVFFKMKPWNYGLIIFGMFLLLNIFTASATSKAIADAGFSRLFLMIGVGFVLGVATGRVLVPISILLPILVAQFGWQAVTPVSFAILFFAVYQGYVISPVHPCVLVTLEYFGADMKSFLRLLIFPVAVNMIFALAVGLMLL